MDICWGCRLAQVAGLVRSSWSSLSGRVPSSAKSKTASSVGQAGSQGNVPQNIRYEGGGVRDIIQGPRAVLPGPTIGTQVVVSYPKITTGPSLVKRKLGSNHWDVIHEQVQGQKRDGALCPASYQSCAASLNGGCCPNDRICDSSSCLPNTLTATPSACGYANYKACGIPEGGGCCPSDYICATDGCTPSPGVVVTETCSAGYYLCPSEFNYGCCKNGLGCAINSCYTTDPVTFTVTEMTTTTDANSIVHILTTTITSQTVIGAPTTTVVGGGVISKASALPVTDTPIPKTAATSPAATSGGISKPELGGIIGGAGVFLIVIIVVAFWILKRLNETIKATQEANLRAASSERQSRKSRRTLSMQQDIDAMSVDPLIMTPSEFGTVRRSSKQSTLHNTTHELASPSSPVVFQYPFQAISPYTQYQPGYNPVASSESQYSGSSAGHNRNNSAEISPQIRHDPSSYFNFNPHPNPRHSQVSSIPPRHGHGRNWSDASDLSATSSDPAELSGDERRSPFQRNLNKIRRSFSRKKSDPPTVLQGGPARADWQGLGNAGGGLGHIDEAGESRINVDRHGDNAGAVITNAELREITLLDQPVRYERKKGNPEHYMKVLGGRSDFPGKSPGNRGHAP